MKDKLSIAAQLHGRLNNGSGESSMGSGAFSERNAADGAARQLFIYYVLLRGRKPGSSTAICPAGCGSTSMPWTLPSRVCTLQV